MLKTEVLLAIRPKMLRLEVVRNIVARQPDRRKAWNFQTTDGKIY
ncbi:MAG: hypothetical protein ACREBU_04735 [Nitrososphaera sp.]